MAGDFERLFGKILFGQKRADDCSLVEDAAEQNVLANIIACLDAGMSIRQIASILEGSKNGR